jgi:DNA-binding winged helix-turn-helix (wHTH) protein
MLTYAFEEFAITPSQRRIFREGTEVELRDRDFDVLLMLIENRPQVLSKDNIIKCVWDGLIVEDNSVERSIVNIRKVLGDDASNPRFIKTVRGRGYLFAADVQETNNMVFPSRSVYKTVQGRPGKKWFAPILVSLILIVACAFVWWSSDVSFERLTARVVFQDDFSDNGVDAEKWTVTGSSVRVSDGTAQITVDKVDSGGHLQSSPFAVDPDKPLIVKSRIRVSYNQSVNANVDFIGAFGFVLPNEQLAGEAQSFYGVKYANAEGEFCYQGNILKTEGFYLVKNDGDVRQNRHHTEGKIGPQTEPVWDKWVEQKLVYDPGNETLFYLVDGEKKSEFVIGKLPFGDGKRLRLIIYPQGWWLHHSIEVDDIEVYQ